MKDIYNEPEIGGGDIAKTTFKLNKKSIKNPMATFLKDTKDKRFGTYSFRQISSTKNK